MVEIKISQKQAQKFAKEILADIEKYVNEHQEEYRQFMQKEGIKNNENPKTA